MCENLKAVKSKMRANLSTNDKKVKKNVNKNINKADRITKCRKRLKQIVDPHFLLFVERTRKVLTNLF